MGGNITRVFRNFNLENRAHRVIGEKKTTTAPLHPRTKDAIQAVISENPYIQEKINKKDDILLSYLKEVYVDSSDPPVEVRKDIPPEQEERRLPKQTLKINALAILDVENIPKGKISIPEVLTALNNHKHSPETWTAEKIAEEYSLNLPDSKALLEFFMPFDVKIIAKKNKEMTET
ncbi:NADH dehydrogenase [ubiquinone] 1 alpha subcomplex assembly factor 4 [Bombina bombina]|uniref:NADH dehydrogenase [ubiquinone] 1 alpha subcomplex assembly factor 4 n=1 Tax=Bombina bombina TaxID=8345 RepID=UPI00235AE1B6|nr:NADH dehydrogenase [ubiquinone] 1 alpha subcomplex assembly factor 4 [Bombina bombina]